MISFQGEFIYLDALKLEARINSSQHTGRKVLRNKLHFGRAMHKSIVKYDVVAQNPKTQQLQCKVCQVLDYQLPQSLVGILSTTPGRLLTVQQAIKQKSLIFIPYWEMLNNMSVISARPDLLSLTLQPNHLFRVKFLGFEQMPTCQLVQLIGRRQNAAQLCKFLVAEVGLPVAFQDQIQFNEEIQFQRHLQKGPAITIDPQGASTLDDAFTIRQVQSGFYQVAIHIADPSAFITKINLQHLANHVQTLFLHALKIEMLPHKLVEMASLTPGVIKPAFSLYMTMNESGQIVSQVRFVNTLINSVCQLSYQQAQAIIQGPDDYLVNSNIQFTQQIDKIQLAKSLKTLRNLTFLRKKRRIEKGCFTHDRKQIDFLFQNQKIVGYKLVERLQSHQMIEELMNIACQQAAEFMIKRQQKSALNIQQLPPKAKEMSNLIQQISKKTNSEVDISNLSLFFQRLSSQGIEEIVIDWFKKKYMLCQQPSYYISGRGDSHFSMKSNYTRFTSPLRRLADLIVHFQMRKILQGEDLQPLQPQLLKKINQNNRKLKRLKKQLNEVFFNQSLLASKERVKSKALIVNVGPKTFEIYCPEFSIIRKVLIKKQLLGFKFVKKFIHQDKVTIEIVLDGDRVWQVQPYQKVDLIIEGGSTFHTNHIIFDSLLELQIILI